MRAIIDSITRVLGDSIDQRVISLLAILSSAFALYTGFFGREVDLIQRGVHLSFALTMVFLITGARRGPRRLTNIAFAVIGACSALYFLSNYDAIMAREGELTNTELVLGLASIVVLLEGTRRMIGWALPLISAICLLYAYLGPELPAGLAHRGYSVERLVSHIFLGTDGIYGIPLGVSATFVFMFVLLGAFLRHSGAGEFFNDLALGLTGSRRGGPAKVAVISSALFGTISGSAIANATATGSFTIPLMKRVGYRPHIAASFESLSSLGGQLMPPVMGSAAFVMIEFTQIPYLTIAAAALLPGLLFFFTVFIIVDLEAARFGMHGLRKDQLPGAVATLREGWLLFVPLILLFVLLYMGMSTFTAAFWTIPATVLATAVKSRTRMNLEKILLAVRDGGKDIIGIAVACACAGVVVGVATLTGLAVDLSNIMIEFARGDVFTLLLLTMVASIILGMGLPTVACYILLAALVAPALEALGVPLLAAHLFIFYFGIVSGITPPVALVSFAAAGVAKADPIATSWAACRMGIVIYILPFIFIYEPAILGVGPWWLIAFTAMTGFASCWMLAIAIQGHWQQRLAVSSRLLVAGLAIALIYPSVPVNAVALAVVSSLAAGFLLRRIRRRRDENLREPMPSDTGG